MDEIISFSYQGIPVRTLNIDGIPWFVGKDVAEILGYSNPQKSLRDHVDDEDKTVNESFTVNGTMGILVNESGLYSLILSSKLPSAKSFKRWVTSEVLPSLRKTGSYNTGAISQAEYLRAASIIATSSRRNLPLVLEALERAGIKLSAEVLKLQESGEEKPVSERKLARMEAGRQVVEAVQRLRENRIAMQVLLQETGIARTVLWRYMNGMENPSPERAQLIVNTVEKLIAKKRH